LSRPKELVQRARSMCKNCGKWKGRGDFCLFVYCGRKCGASVVC